VDTTCNVVEPEKVPSKPSKQTTLQRQLYENTAGFDDTEVARQAQLNQDKIFRYVKEPGTEQVIVSKNNVVSRFTGIRRV